MSASFQRLARTLCGALALLLGVLPALAAPIDGVAFDDPALERRYHRLIEELRCLKCQNTSIAGSNAELARDHRRKVYELMVERGLSDAEIKRWFTDRYGDFALYRPRLAPRTWLLWGLPVLLLPFALAAVVALQARRRRETAHGALTDAERKRLEALLK